MKRLSFLIAIYGTTLIAAQAAELQFDSAESLKAWTFDPGAEFPGAKGSLVHRPESGHGEAGALGLNFDFRSGGNYVSISTDLPTSPATKAVRVWLNKPAANLMFVRAVDSNGETFQKDLRFDYRGWQEVIVNLENWDHSWGGDGNFDHPATNFHIVIEGQGGVNSGTLLVDDIEWLEKLPPNEHEVVGTYVESDFAGSPGWSLSGPEGVSLVNRVWTYRFTDEQTVCGLHYGFSALAKPEAMLLTLESDGSGHAVHATFGSHFQNFDREIGTLAEKGEITLEVPLGDMKSWNHSSGQNDGIVRYPLRLLNIAVIKKGKGTSGQLQLKNVAFRTKYDQRAPVFVVPKVQALGGGLLKFDVTLRSLHDEPIRGRLDFRLYTPSTEILTQQLDVIAPPLASHTVSIPAGFGSHPVVEGAFSFSSESMNGREQTISIAKPRPFDPKRVKLDPDSRMGVGMYLYRFHNHPNARAEMAKLCRLAAAAGVKWTREEFHWNWVENPKGTYDWSFFDELVDEATKHGISVYGLVCYWTEWSQPPFDDRFVKDYCDYLRVLVARYKDRIKHWEIWNEPNIFFWPGDKDRYAVLLREAYKAIKETDPDAKVLGMSTAGIDVAFIEKMTELGVEYDDLTVHPYRHSLDPIDFLAELQRTSAMFDNRPIWITEMGWPSNIGGVTERQQAALVSGVYLTSLASPVVRNVSWYNFREDGTDPFYNEHHFGLIRHDMTPKIGYAALATIGEHFSGARLIDTHAGERGLLSARYVKPDGYLTALAMMDGNVLIRLKLNTSVTLIDMTGAQRDIPQSDQVVTLTMLRGEPIYLASKEALNFERLEDAIVIHSPAGGQHAGDTLELHYESEAYRVVSLQAPSGWKISPGADKKMSLTVPPTAVPAEYEILVNVTNDQDRWTLPAIIRITDTTLVR